MTLCLGLDVGNAKLKLCAGPADASSVRWSSARIRYTDALRYRRHQDFEEGLASGLTEFLGAALDDVREVVAVNSSGYAYPTYHEGVRHTFATLARLLPHARCHALSGTGELVDAEEIASADAARLDPITFTNALGAAHLARRLSALGFDPERGREVTALAVDTGGSTSGATPIVEGVFDPEASATPARFLEHRLLHGKLTWIGVQTTPLEMLASHVELARGSFPVIPRGLAFDHVAHVLELLPAEHARRLALFKLAPDRALSLRGIADTLNLDPSMASEEELLSAARAFHRAATRRLSASLERAGGALRDRADASAIAFGLGASALTRPALLEAGWPSERVRLGADLLAASHADAASCFGAWHFARERLLGRPLAL